MTHLSICYIIHGIENFFGLHGTLRFGETAVTRKKAFTLIELLVVISIIALLLSILMPALGKAKKKAQNIICRSDLKQWGMAWMMYSQDYKNRFFRGMTGSGDTLDDWWLSKLWKYAPAEAMWFCPAANKYDPRSTRYIGSTFEAWGPFEFSENGNRTGKMAFSSYGVNLWVLNPTPETVNPYGYRRSNFWRRSDVSGADKIPLMLDAAFSGAYAANLSDPSNGGSLNRPLDKGAYNFSYSATINTFCIDRHEGTTNSVFLDFSVRTIGLKELWKQKWHRNYNISDYPQSWPEWMSRYK